MVRAHFTLNDRWGKHCTTPCVTVFDTNIKRRLSMLTGTSSKVDVSRKLYSTRFRMKALYCEDSNVIGGRQPTGALFDKLDTDILQLILECLCSMPFQPESVDEYADNTDVYNHYDSVRKSLMAFFCVCKFTNYELRKSYKSIVDEMLARFLSDNCASISNDKMSTVLLREEVSRWEVTSAITVFRDIATHCAGRHCQSVRRNFNLSALTIGKYLKMVYNKSPVALFDTIHKAYQPKILRIWQSHVAVSCNRDGVLACVSTYDHLRRKNPHCMKIKSDLQHNEWTHEGTDLSVMHKFPIDFRAKNGQQEGLNDWDIQQVHISPCGRVIVISETGNYEEWRQRRSDFDTEATELHMNYDGMELSEADVKTRFTKDWEELIKRHPAPITQRVRVQILKDDALQELAMPHEFQGSICNLFVGGSGLLTGRNRSPSHPIAMFHPNPNGGLPDIVVLWDAEISLQVCVYRASNCDSPIYQVIDEHVTACEGHRNACAARAGQCANASSVSPNCLQETTRLLTCFSMALEGSVAALAFNCSYESTMQEDEVRFVQVLLVLDMNLKRWISIGSRTRTQPQEISFNSCIVSPNGCNIIWLLGLQYISSLHRRWPDFIVYSRACSTVHYRNIGQGLLVDADYRPNGPPQLKYTAATNSRTLAALGCFSPCSTICLIPAIEAFTEDYGPVVVSIDLSRHLKNPISPYYDPINIQAIPITIPMLREGFPRSLRWCNSGIIIQTHEGAVLLGRKVSTAIP
jgi:hypothetical protein